MPPLRKAVRSGKRGLRVGITATTMAKEVADLFFYENLGLAVSALPQGLGNRQKTFIWTV